MDPKVRAALENIASDCKWVMAVVPHLMGSERSTLIDAREVALELSRLDIEENTACQTSAK